MNINLCVRDEWNIAFNIHYNCTYYRTLSWYYRRLALIFDVTNLVFGSAAVASLFADCKIAGIVSGIAIAIVQALNLFIRPAELRIQSEASRQKWVTLRKEAKELSVEEADTRFHELSAEDAPNVPSLRRIAYNITLDEHGQDKIERLKTSVWGRLKYAIANL